MAYSLNLKVLEQAFSELNYLDNDKKVSFQVVSAGVLHVSSGSISASDPLVEPDQPSFTQKVVVGDYEVKLAIARFDGGDERIAFAMVSFSEDQPVEWKMALIANQNEKTLGHDEFFGYGVDSGTGCFMDSDAGALMSERMRQQEDFFEEIIEGMEATYRHTRSWLSFQPSSASKANVVCFSSGWGDGVYPSFFSYSDSGKVVSLVTDFCVFSDSNPITPSKAKKPWWQFWK